MVWQVATNITPVLKKEFGIQLPDYTSSQVSKWPPTVVYHKFAPARKLDYWGRGFEFHCVRVALCFVSVGSKRRATNAVRRLPQIQ